MTMTNSDRCKVRTQIQIARAMFQSLDHTISIGSVDRAIAIAWRLREVIATIDRALSPADRSAQSFTRFRVYGHLVLSEYLCSSSPLQRVRWARTVPTHEHTGAIALSHALHGVACELDEVGEPTC
jgi:hypothetical protein